MNILPPSFNFSNNRTLFSGSGMSMNSGLSGLSGTGVNSGSSLPSGSSLTNASGNESGTGNDDGCIEKRIKILKDKGDILIVDLKDRELEVFDEVVTYMRDKEQGELEKIRRFINKNFKSKTPGTVSAFFSECFKSKTIGLNEECTGLANKNGKETCKDLVLAYQSGAFLKLNNMKHTNHVYIYMKDTKYISEVNMKKLSDAGCNEATLIFDDESEKKIKFSKHGKGKDGKNGQNGNGNGNTGNGWSILLFIFFLIILVGLSYFVWTNSPKIYNV